MTVTSGYADGWNTPGWTAQDANLPDATPGSPSWEEMGLPPGMTGLPVTGTWYDQYGPAWGSLVFTPSVPSVVVNGVELEFIPYRVFLRDGQLPVGLSVPVPDAGATVLPTSWIWTVTGRVGPRNVSYTIPIPSATSPFDLVNDSPAGGGSSSTAAGDIILDGGLA